MRPCVPFAPKLPQQRRLPQHQQRRHLLQCGRDRWAWSELLRRACEHIVQERWQPERELRVFRGSGEHFRYVAVRHGWLATGQHGCGSAGLQDVCCW
jgi:hypothetical protein